MIALLSNYCQEEVVDPASHGWLGHHHDDKKIRESGLWNVQGVVPSDPC